jgi:cell division protein FtsL
MTRTRFLLILFVINLGFIFAKIYQHNLFIKLNYEKQRLENKKNELRKERNKLLSELFILKNQRDVKRLAQEKLGMKPLKLSQVITLTQGTFGGVK